MNKKEINDVLLDMQNGKICIGEAANLLHGSQGQLAKPEMLPIEQQNLTDLRNRCKDYIDFIDNDALYSEDNDLGHYIFESAMEAFYGCEIWDYVNKRQP